MRRDVNQQHALQTSLPSETRLSCRFLEQALEAGVSAPSARRVLGAFASHLLLPAGVLRKQMEGQTNTVRGGRVTHAGTCKGCEIANSRENSLANCTYEAPC